MKEELYRSMYRQVHLSETQKHHIWAGVEAANESLAGRKAHVTLRGAVCVCAVLMASGITALATNSSYVERISDALHHYGGNGGEATPEQKELCAAYGSEIGYTWDTAAGTVTLEAVLYDDGFLCIPFTLYPNVELTPGADLSQDLSSRQIRSDLSGRIDQDAEGEQCYFRLEGHRREDLDYFTQLNPIVQEDGSLTGSYLVEYAWKEERGFTQGDVILRVKEIPWPEGEPWARVLQEGESTEGLTIYDVEINGEIVRLVDLTLDDEVLQEIPLEGAPVPKREISTAGIQLPYGLTADSITITSLALYMHGTGDFNQPGVKITDHMAVVLKDGTVVEKASNAVGMSRGDRDENDEYKYAFHMLFADTINPDDVAGIRITELGEEILWIPAQ